MDYFSSELKKKKLGDLYVWLKKVLGGGEVFPLISRGRQHKSEKGQIRQALRQRNAKPARVNGSASEDLF